MLGGGYPEDRSQPPDDVVLIHSGFVSDQAVEGVFSGLWFEDLDSTSHPYYAELEAHADSGWPRLSSTQPRSQWESPLPLVREQGVVQVSICLTCMVESDLVHMCCAECTYHPQN